MIPLKSTDLTSLTCIGHGEAAGRVHHVHLWHQFGNILVLGQSKAEHLVLVGAGGEKASCWTHKHTAESFQGKLTLPGNCSVDIDPKFSLFIQIFHRKICPEEPLADCLMKCWLKHLCLFQHWQLDFSDHWGEKKTDHDRENQASPADGKPARKRQITAWWNSKSTENFAFAHTLQMLKLWQTNRSQKNRYKLKPSQNVCSAFPPDSPDADSFAPSFKSIRDRHTRVDADAERAVYTSINSLSVCRMLCLLGTLNILLQLNWIPITCVNTATDVNCRQFAGWEAQQPKNKKFQIWDCWEWQYQLICTAVAQKS